MWRAERVAGPGREHVEIEKEEVGDLLRSQGEFDKAQQVECALPQHVDTEQDAALLYRFDINISELPNGATPARHRQQTQPRPAA